MREIVTPDGKLILTEAALAAVARGAALRCPGVIGTVARGLPDEIRGLLRGEGETRDGAGYGVEVELDADHLGVTVDIVVAFGAHIPTVASAVMTAVAEDLGVQAGIRPRRLQVRVQGVRRPDAVEAAWQPGARSRGEAGAGRSRADAEQSASSRAPGGHAAADFDASGAARDASQGFAPRESCEPGALGWLATGPQGSPARQTDRGSD